MTRYDDVKAVLSDPRFTRTGPGRGARVSDAEEGGVFNSDLRRVEGLVVGGLRELPVRW